MSESPEKLKIRIAELEKENAELRGRLFQSSEELRQLNISQLIDIKLLSALLDRFHDLTSFPVALITPRGEAVLTKGLPRICELYHNKRDISTFDCHKNFPVDELNRLDSPTDITCEINLHKKLIPLKIKEMTLAFIILGPYKLNQQHFSQENSNSFAQSNHIDPSEYWEALQQAPGFDEDQVTKAYQYMLSLGRMIETQLSYNIELGHQLSVSVQTEMELKRSQKLYELVTQNIHDVIWTMDLDLNFTYLSPSTEKIFGYNLEERENIHLKQIFTEKSYEYIKDILKKKLSQIKENKPISTPLHLDIEGVHKSGEKIWVEITTDFIYNHKHEPIGIIGSTRDTTERKRAESKLKENEKFLRHILDNMTDIVVILNTKGEIHYLSPSYERLTGNKTNTLLGHSFYHMIHPEDKTSLAFILEIINSDNDYFSNIQLRYLNQKGHYTWIETSGKALRDEQNKLIGVIMNGRDVSERRIAEKQINEHIKDLNILSQNTHELLKFNIHDDIYLHICHKIRNITSDALILILFCNKECQHFNIRSHSISGHYWTETANKIPDNYTDIKIPNQINAENKKQLYHQQLFPLSFHSIFPEEKDAPEPIQPFLHEINKHQDAYTYAMGFDYSDALKGIICIIKKGNVPLKKGVIETLVKQSSVSIQKQEAQKSLIFNEQKFRNIFEISPDAIALTSYKTGVFFDINSSFSHLTNYSREHILNHTLRELNIVTKEQDKELIRQLKEQGSIKNQEIEIHANNGKIIPCLISASLMYIHSEQYILFMLRNIEDIKNVQYELILAKEKAQESDQLKSAFLANMSHEIRTPMNGIMGFCELMINTEQPKEKQDFFLHYIYENSKQLLTLINDIIDISRIEARQLSVHQTETNLNKTIHDLEIYFKNEKNRINKYDINITSNVNLPDDSALILTDKTRLKQILINLINNALKFTHKGYIKFGYDYNKNDQSLLFYVNDTGIGISPKDQQMIFERFKQADQSTKRRYGGTGLGLAISKELVELMGGTIWVRSEPGAGTTFYFSLPYTPVLPRKEQTNVPENKKHDWTTKKILIIEDHIAGYNYLRSALEITGARLSWSKNGEHALKLLKNSSGMDAILMDINLPDMKGSALLSKIKEYAPSLPVIAQTAFAMQGDKEKMLEQGFDDYISKPIERQILMDKLSQLWND